MPEQTLNERVKVPSPQLLIRGSSSGAAYAGDCVGEVPPHRPPKVAAEEQAAAKANPQLSLVIRKSGGRPTRRKGKVTRCAPDAAIHACERSDCEGERGGPRGSAPRLSATRLSAQVARTLKCLRKYVYRWIEQYSLDLNEYRG